MTTKLQQTLIFFLSMLDLALKNQFRRFPIYYHQNFLKTNVNFVIARLSNEQNFLKTNHVNFVIARLSNEEILDIINSLKNKSTGPYSIPLRLLSVIPDLIILPLAYIINLSFLNGEYPDLLKIVKVIPIHKGGSTQDINNYRPISLLSIFDKIMEKLIHKRLYNFLEEQNVL